MVRPLEQRGLVFFLLLLLQKRVRVALAKHTTTTAVAWASYNYWWCWISGDRILFESQTRNIRSRSSTNSVYSRENNEHQIRQNSKKKQRNTGARSALRADSTVHFNVSLHLCARALSVLLFLLLPPFSRCLVAGAMGKKTTNHQQLEQTLRALLVAYEEEKQKTSQKLSKMATLFRQLQEQEEGPAESVAPSRGPTSLRNNIASNGVAGGGGGSGANSTC